MSTIYNPLSSYRSTHLNSRLKGDHTKLAERILFSIGTPVISLEVACDQIMDAIAEAVELYTKHVGFTRENLIFRSDIYEIGWGIDLSKLFSITPEMRASASSPSLSACYDYDLESNRKVLGVYEFNEGVSSGVGNLFTIESTMMNMVFFSPSIGNFGFDVLSWHIAKEYLEMREKAFATKIHYTFNKDTQLMRLFPEPKINETLYYGLVGCYVEKPWKDCINQRWVYEYAQALVMQRVGWARGKYNGTTLFGSGTISNDILAIGNERERELRKEIQSSLHSDWKGVAFFVG